MRVDWTSRPPSARSAREAAAPGRPEPDARRVVAILGCSIR